MQNLLRGPAAEHLDETFRVFDRHHDHVGFEAFRCRKNLRDDLACSSVVRGAPLNSHSRRVAEGVEIASKPRRNSLAVAVGV